MGSIDKAPDLVRKKPVTSAALDQRAKAGGWRYPPSFRRVVEEHGLFTLGKVTPATDHLCFTVWPVKDHKPALELLADELGCDADAAEVAEQLGIPEAHAAALAHLIVVGSEGHEDFCAFDLRTRDPKTGECSFRLVLFDDTEIADAAKPGKQCKGDGFATWLDKHIAWRAKERREPTPTVEAPPATAPAKLSSGKPDKAFAKLGTFTTVPRADVEKRIAKLLAPKKLGKDIWWNEGELPDVAFVHRGDIRGDALKITSNKPGIYVIEGDLVAANHLNLDASEDVILLVAGDVKTTNLRVGFATTLLVEGDLRVERMVTEAIIQLSVAGKTTATQIFLCDADQRPKFGTKPDKGVIVPFDRLDDVVGDRYGLAPDAPVLFRKIITGKKFLRVET